MVRSETKKIRTIIVDHHIINNLDIPKSDIIINPAKDNKKFVDDKVSLKEKEIMTI